MTNLGLIRNYFSKDYFVETHRGKNET